MGAAVLAAVLGGEVAGGFLVDAGEVFVVTGLTWQWLLNPDFGIQKVVRDWGWETFEFAPLASNDWAIYGVRFRPAE